MSILHGVAADDERMRQAALERFSVEYTDPLIRFLVATRRIGEDEASDVVQDFWIRKLLEPEPAKNLVASYLRACESRPEASFRKYLAKSLIFHFVDICRNAKEKRFCRMASLQQLKGFDPKGEDYQQEFDRAWANHLLEKVLIGVKDECAASGHIEKWQVFVHLIIRPSLHNTTRPSYAELAKRLSLGDPKAIGNAWITVKRMIDRHFSAAVQDYLPSTSYEDHVREARAEVAELLHGLASSGYLCINSARLGIEAVPACSGGRIDFESPSVSSLYQDSDDLRCAWSSFTSTNLVSVLNLEEASGAKSLTITDLTSGRSLILSDLELLRGCCKSIGKRSDDRLGETSFLPTSIVGLVYVLAILAANRYFNKWISSSTRDHVRRGAQRYLSESWIGPETDAFLRSCIAEDLG